MAYFKSVHQKDNPGEDPDMAHHGARSSRAVVFTQNHLAENSEIKILALFA